MIQARPPSRTFLSVRRLVPKPIPVRFADDLGTRRTLLHRKGLESRIPEDAYAAISLTSYLGLFASAALMLDGSV